MKNDDEARMTRIFDQLAKFMFLTEQTCTKKHLDYSEDAVREILTESKPWLDYYGQGIGEKPIVFRLNRNLGYITGNMFVGTKADKQRFAKLHAQQRTQPGAAPTPRPDTTDLAKLGRYGIDYGQRRKQIEDKPRTKSPNAPHDAPPPKAGDAISNHTVTKREAKLWANKLARQQTDAAQAAALAKPPDALSQDERRLRKNAREKLRQRQKRARIIPRPT